MVHIKRQLSVLLRVHDRQGATRHHSVGKHSGQRGAGSAQAALLRAIRRRLRVHQSVQDGQRGKSCRRY